MLRGKKGPYERNKTMSGICCQEREIGPKEGEEKASEKGAENWLQYPTVLDPSQAVLIWTPEKRRKNYLTK